MFHTVLFLFSGLALFICGALSYALGSVTSCAIMSMTGVLFLYITVHDRKNFKSTKR